MNMISMILVVIGVSLLVYAFRSKIFRKGGKKMKKDKIEAIDVMWLVLLIVTSIIIIFGSVCITSIFTTQKDVTITSKVNHVFCLKDYMVVHFNDGQSYNVYYPYDNYVIDFDESKNVTIKLHYHNPLWYFNSNNVWDIINIIKY